MSKRKNPSQLPSSSELDQILAAESERPIPAAKSDAHYPKLDFIETIDLGADTGFLHAGSAHEVLAQGDKFVTSMVRLIQGGSIAPDQLEQIFNFLAEDDAPEVVDIIFVFGVKSDIRARKATELYLAGIAPKIIFTGGNSFYTDERDSTESEAASDVAISLGVNPADIILESNSITIPDNVRSGLNILDGLLKWQKMAIVTSPHAMRRSWCHLMKYIDTDQQLIRINAPKDGGISRDNWYQSEGNIRLILNELVKLRVAITTNTA